MPAYTRDFLMPIKRLGIKNGSVVYAMPLAAPFIFYAAVFEGSNEKGIFLKYILPLAVIILTCVCLIYLNKITKVPKRD